jgi:hypothetical protein
MDVMITILPVFQLLPNSFAKKFHFFANIYVKNVDDFRKAMLHFTFCKK